MREGLEKCENLRFQRKFRHLNCHCQISTFVFSYFLWRYIRRLAMKTWKGNLNSYKLISNMFNFVIAIKKYIFCILVKQSLWANLIHQWMSAKDVISPARNFAAHKRNETKQNETNRNKTKWAETKRKRNKSKWADDKLKNKTSRNKRGKKGENENKWRSKIFTRNLKMRGRGTRGDKVKNKYNFRNE